jgi:hypothetical protein
MNLENPMARAAVGEWRSQRQRIATPDHVAARRIARVWEPIDEMPAVFAPNSQLVNLLVELRLEQTRADQAPVDDGIEESFGSKLGSPQRFSTWIHLLFPPFLPESVSKVVTRVPVQVQHASHAPWRILLRKNATRRRWGPC